MNNYSNGSPHYKTAIVGADGYSGRVLARLLLNHPNAELTAVFTRHPHWQLSDVLPELTHNRAIGHYPVDSLNEHAKQLDIVFLATPPEASMTLAPKLLAQGVKVIDLSGAYRLSADEFQKAYGLQAPAHEDLSQSQFGLSPWWKLHSAHQDIQLIANPGCFATCALMALLPLLTHQLIDPNSIVIDAKSGLTGAGKKANSNLLFCEMSEECYPYKIGTHQHVPEITHYAHQFAHTTITPLMSTYVLPIKRGITMALYAQLAPHLNSEETIIHNVKAAYAKAYAHYPLVKIDHLNAIDINAQTRLLALKHVVGSARTHIGYQVAGQRLMVYATLDNLMKGAASQAIENFNALIGQPLTYTLTEHEGLL